MAYPAGTTVSYNNAPCLYLQTVIDIVAEEKEYTKANVGFIDLLQSQVNKDNAPVKIVINNDGKTQDTSSPGKFDFVYYAQDCTETPVEALGSCTAASGGQSYAGKTTKQFTLDKSYRVGSTIELTDKKIIEKLISNKFIK